MRILVAVDNFKQIVAKSLTQDATYLAEEIRRRTNQEVTMVELSQRQVRGLAPYRAVVVVTNLWRGKVGEAALELVQDAIEQVPNTFFVVSSYLSEGDFKNSLPKAVPTEILESVITFQLGNSVDSSLLSPLEKIWWNLSRQQIETPYSKQKITEIASTVVKTASKDKS